ncbi:hypothetical protein V6N12_008027 [Hibiscus sabdariffa]|uniref:Uncharacterized protein n=1 Tax=Hibiscus sabdariffa TaxID=183260 RepID=A0ABR2BSN4_9ROSI
MVPSMPLYVVFDKSTENSPVSNDHNDPSEASPAVNIPVSEGDNSNDSFATPTEELGHVEHNSNTSSSSHTEEGEQLQLHSHSVTPVHSQLDAVIDELPAEYYEDIILQNEALDTLESSGAAPDSTTIKSVKAITDLFRPI